MNAKHILDAMETIDDSYIIQAEAGRSALTGKARPFRRRTFLLIAAVIAVLAALTLCGFSRKYESLWNVWFQPIDMPNASEEVLSDPPSVVRETLENERFKDYYTIVKVDEVYIDEDATHYILTMYSGSKLAESRGWTDEFFAEHFVVVHARYYCEYDHTKTPLEDGWLEQYFWLGEDENGYWSIVESSSTWESGSPGPYNYDALLAQMSSEPVDQVRNYLEEQLSLDVCLAMQVDDVWFDEAETARAAKIYADSGDTLVEYFGWTEEFFLEEHFAVVCARYYCEYESEEIPELNRKGWYEQYFWIVNDEALSYHWTIVEVLDPQEIPAPSGTDADQFSDGSTQVS